LPQGFFPPLWHGFLLGVGAYWAWRDRGLVPWFTVYALLIGASSIITYDWFSLVCVLTAAILLWVGIADRLQKAWNWRWLQFLGMISYSLYLIHNPITGATFRVGYMITGRNVYLEALWWCASIAASITVAWAMWWAVERPSLQLARKISFASHEGKKQ
jgi:peptidoglycan/LPS O-acetylase OafA/YrhL